MAVMGGVKTWFKTHMVLGLVGPIFILYHANFSLGATNSNIALFCMLVVSGSGLVGRYFYTRIHFGLTDRVTNLSELQDNANRLRSVSLSMPFMPELLQRLAAVEQTLLSKIEHCPVLLRSIYSAMLSTAAKRDLRTYMRHALHATATQSDAITSQRAHRENCVR